ncbi:MAG TPA: aminotransferase class V-fold PLP-dependent enzyme [Longimicrobium sp.]|nr:aminotransferase class V-fold PLP-dependent enzyme [Longimicrobium sp.]
MTNFATAAAAPLDVLALREREFPELDGRRPYLNAASMGALPQRARRAMEEYNARRAAVHLMRGADFEPVLQRARAAAARLVNADADDVALAPNTSYGLNLAAQSLPVEPGRRVVLSDREFPANVYPWLALEREGRARVDIIPADALGRPDEERLLAEIERGDVGIFALSAVQFATGYAADLARFGQACRRNGTWFVVDAIQALGCVPVDVRVAEIDVLACGGHKWLCGPFGTGFVYLRPGLAERMEPRVVGWTAMAASANYADCCAYRWEFVEGARRFEVATQPFQDAAGFVESMELLLETGVERIHAHVTALHEPLIGWLAAREDAQTVTELDPARRSGVFSFRIGDVDRAYAALHRAGVGCVPREGAIRLSPHLYNTAGEMARVIDVLDGME